MSYHVLHVLQPLCTLGKERGFLTCKSENGTTRRMPHEDVRAVIVAARGVTLTSSFLSAIMETDGIVLHCNEAFQPCGVTSPLTRVTDTTAFLRQASRPRKLNERLWEGILRGKTLNQLSVLKSRELDCLQLRLALERNHIDEGNCAKRYWQLYFPSIGWLGTSRDRRNNTPPNQMLNYGYAVLSALCHRSLLIHGLSPLLGVKHTTRYRSHPLVYDLMEPFRPLVDQMLAEFLLEADVNMPAWCRKVGETLRIRRVHHQKFTLKMLDAVDASAASMARSYRENSVEPFWVPEL